jgi:hypothetical protein
VAEVLDELAYVLPPVRPSPISPLLKQKTRVRIGIV